MKAVAEAGLLLVAATPLRRGRRVRRASGACREGSPPLVRATSVDAMEEMLPRRKLGVARLQLPCSDAFPSRTGVGTRSDQGPGVIEERTGAARSGAWLTRRPGPPSGGLRVELLAGEVPVQAPTGE